jgi:hypothetical protein
VSSPALPTTRLLLTSRVVPTDTTTESCRSSHRLSDLRVRRVSAAPGAGFWRFRPKHA